MPAGANDVKTHRSQLCELAHVATTLYDLQVGSGANSGAPVIRGTWYYEVISLQKDCQLFQLWAEASCPTWSSQVHHADFPLRPWLPAPRRKVQRQFGEGQSPDLALGGQLQHHNGRMCLSRHCLAALKVQDCSWFGSTFGKGCVNVCGMVYLYLLPPTRQTNPAELQSLIQLLAQFYQ